MATRQFNFIVGPETSTLPSIGSPTSDDDLISLGFADDRYTQGGEAVADITALKAIVALERRDGDFFLVKSTNNVYRFDSASSATGDDNFVLTPTAGSGRWIRVTILNRANTFTDTTQSTTKDTGGAIFEGGVGIEKNLNVGGNVIVTGDLTVNGTTTTVSSTTLDVADANITVNKGGTVSSANSAVSGITVDTDTTDGRLGYDSTLASRFKAGDSGSESEIMTVGTTQTVSGAKTFSAAVNVSDTTQSTTKDTGSLILEGGLGVEKNVNVGGNLVVTGDLTVSGTTTTINSTTVDIVDANITVNKGGTIAAADSAVAGITVDTDATDARIGYTSSLASRFKAGDSGSESEIMTVGTAQTVTGIKTHTDNIIVDNAKEVRFSELDINGSSYIGLRAPDSLSGSTTFKLPIADGTANQAIVTDGSTQLSFATVATDNLNEFNVKVGNVSNLAASVDTSAVGDISASSSTGLNIKTGVIVNADINASAAIDYSKLATLTSANIVLGNVSNVATSTAVTGDVVISNTGVTAISSGVIVNADINASAAIDGSKIVSATDSVAGVVTTASQTFAGDKTFTGAGDVAITIKSNAVGDLAILTLNRGATASGQLGTVGVSGDFFTGEAVGDLIIRSQGTKAIRLGNDASEFGTMSSAGVWTLGPASGSAAHAVRSGGTTSLTVTGGTASSPSSVIYNRSGTADLVIGNAGATNDHVTGSAVGDAVIAVQGGSRNLLFGTSTTVIGGKMNGNGAWTLGASGGTETHTINGTLAVNTIDSTTTAGVKIKGRTDGAAATTGYVGQVITATQAATNASAGNVYGDVTSISVTAGVWILTGHVRLDRNGATAPCYLGVGFGTISGNNAPDLGELVNADFGTGIASTLWTNFAYPCSPYIYANSATTTVYLKALVNTVSGTQQWGGTIRATRIA